MKRATPKPVASAATTTRTARPSASRKAAPAKTGPAAEGKPSHRRRLLEAMTETIARGGYGETTVAQIIEHAGVSRATFYEHFTDKEDCFLAAQKDLSGGVSRLIKRTMNSREPGTIQVLLLPVLLDLAEHRRSGLQLLANESLAAGPRAMDARDAMLAKVEQAVEGIWLDATDPIQVPDVPVKALVGGTIRLVANRLRQGDNHLPDLLPGLACWFGSYLPDGDGPRWSAMESERSGIMRDPRPPSEGASSEKLVPRPLPRGRHKLPAGYVKRNRRERIMLAVTELALSKGYAPTSVADIVAVAGVSRDVFYDNFHDKQEAFVASYELGFRETLAATAGAFFRASTWPDRVWDATKAFTDFFDSEPGISQIGFVEAHALGPAFARRVTDTQIAFTMFIEEGYRQRAEAERLPRLCSEAIAASIFEMAYHQQRHYPQLRMTDMLGDMAYVALAPFMGPHAAAELVRAKLAEEH